MLSKNNKVFNDCTNYFEYIVQMSESEVITDISDHSTHNVLNITTTVLLNASFELFSLITNYVITPVATLACVFALIKNLYLRFSSNKYKVRLKKQS